MFFIDKYIPNKNNLNYFHKDTYNFLKTIANTHRFYGTKTKNGCE